MTLPLNAARKSSQKKPYRWFFRSQQIERSIRIILALTHRALDLAERCSKASGNIPHPAKKKRQKAMCGENVPLWHFATLVEFS